MLLTLLYSPLWQSCQAKLQATQEELAAEDTNQYTVATPTPAHMSDTLQPPTHLPTARITHGQPTRLTEPIPTSLLLAVPHTLPAGPTAVPTVTRIQNTATKLLAEVNTKQYTMPLTREAASDAKPPAKKKKKTAANVLSQEATLTRVPEPASHTSLLPITHSFVLPGIHHAEMQHAHPRYDDTVRHNLLNRVAFGKAFWAHYFGDIGESPALPHDIHAILTSPCPFWPNRLVYETHLLVLIPARVNGCPFSLNLLGELIQNPKGNGHRTQYRFFDHHVQTQLGAAIPGCSYWVLVTRDVLAESRDTSYANQQVLVAGYAGYALPSTLEVATAILLHHVHTGERLFSDDPWTYTHCRDRIDWNGHLYPVLVGGFSSSGLDVYDDIGSSFISSVATCRKF